MSSLSLSFCLTVLYRLQVWDGFNATIIGYGQVGTGKTHCLFGDVGHNGISIDAAAATDDVEFINTDGLLGFTLRTIINTNYTNIKHKHKQAPLSII